MVETAQLSEESDNWELPDMEEIELPKPIKNIDVPYIPLVILPMRKVSGVSEESKSELVSFEDSEDYGTLPREIGLENDDEEAKLNDMMDDGWVLVPTLE